MDTSLLRSRRKNTGHYASHIFPILVALTAGSGMLHATNLLGTFASNGTTAITSVSLSCNTATGPGPSATIIVKAVPALTSTNQLIVSATPLSASGTVNTLSGTGAANVVITAPSSQTLTASVTSLTYTVSLAATPSVGCNGLTTAAPVFFFNHIAGTTSAPGSTVVGDIGMTVNTAITETASGLVATPSTVNLTCVKSGSTYYPGPAQTVSVTSVATGGTVFGLDSGSNGGTAPAGWATLAPTSPTGTATGTAVTFTVQAAAACDSLASSGSNTASTTISLLSTGTTAPDKVITVNLTVSPPSASSLAVSPSSVTVTCANNSGTYVPNYPQTVSVTAPSATAFTVDTGSNAPPSWLVVTPTTGGTASTNSVNFTLQAASGCNAGTGATTVIHLDNAPASDKLISVTLQIVPAKILAASPAAPSLTYVKGSGTAGFVDVTISPTNSTTPFFTVNTATLPSWLRVDSTSAAAPHTLQFSSTTVADTLAPGTYSATVVISVAGYGDLNLPVTMLLTNKAPLLTVQAPPSSEACTPASATTFCIPWTIGQGLPTPTLTVISTDTPIAYTATTGGLLAPVIPAAEVNGLAYSFGTPVNITFGPLAFASAQPGQVLTGTATFTWGSPVSTEVITFQVSVLSPGATITSSSPSTVPVLSAGGGPYTVTLTGTGFVVSSDPTQVTKVGVVTTTGLPMTIDTNIHATVVNQSNMTLQVTIPSGTDAAIPFAGGSFNIGVCNPVGGTCSIATSQTQLTIGTNPIVQAVTSSSSLLQNSSVSVAPYDMISIFGANFCPNCTSTQVLTGSPDPNTLTYPTELAFDSSHSLIVTFQPHTGSSYPATAAPLLFATNGQINVMVPSVVAASSGGTDIIVSYGSLTGSPAPKVSTPFNMTIVATDPGVFTIGADGQGNGAALDMNYNLISATNPAGIRTGTGNSDVISIYMTGLGAPDDANLASNASAASDAGYVWSADCVTTTSYLTSFNAAQTGTALNTLDGTLIIPSVLNTGRLVPCLSSAGTDVPSVTIGGVTATATTGTHLGTVKYAGWVPGTIAGLYQVNVQLPDNINGSFTTAAGLTGQNITAPVQLPITITSDGITSQAGVTLWVAPRLKMVGPSSNSAPNTVSATVGVALSATNNSVTATQGTGAMHYAVTSGLLPAGLSIIPSGTNAGLITGTPGANTGGNYTVTVTATDSATVPVTGTNTFVVTVGAGLFLSNTTPTASTSGIANAAVSTVTASGGVAPYTYTATLPTGLAVDPVTGIISTTTGAEAGSYTVTINATDSTPGTPLTGADIFTVVVGLDVVSGVTGSFTNGVTSGAYNTMTTTGNTGTVTYALDSGTSELLGSWLSFSTSTGVLTVTSSSVATSSRTVTITATDGTAPTGASAVGTGSTSFTFVIN